MKFQINQKYALRNFKDTDAPTLASTLANPIISKYTRMPFPYTLDSANYFINMVKDKQTIFAIVDDDIVVGGIDFHPQSGCYSHKAEIGYWLKPELWNQGIIKLALKVLINDIIIGWYNKDHQLTRLYAQVVGPNARSAKVLEANGFKYEVDNNTALRKFRDSDAQVLAQVLVDQEITRYTTIPHPYTLKDAEQFLTENKNQLGLYAIVQNDIVVGAAEFEVQKGCFAHKAVLGYWLKKELWNKGIITKTIGVLLTLINEYNQTAGTRIKRLEAHISHHNEFSGKVLLRHGFEKEGVLKYDFCKDGNYDHTIVYGKILFSNLSLSELKLEYKKLLINKQDTSEIEQYIRTLKFVDRKQELDSLQQEYFENKEKLKKAQEHVIEMKSLVELLINKK
ncbi:hypothetical protein HDV06_006940 [Boothiomyces sp. JEL0866]|nr:hypothetical protein HDV06_006940 [Boothiomyces sp. JEL0866]